MAAGGTSGSGVRKRKYRQGDLEGRPENGRSFFLGAPGRLLQIGKLYRFELLQVETAAIVVKQVNKEWGSSQNGD
jgi:hypothetical protein